MTCRHNGRGVSPRRPRRVRSALIGIAYGCKLVAMNLRRLKYFVKIVDIGSLTQAADVLHIAQPALSQQLATLEGEVRQQLLVRTKRGVTPTEAEIGRAHV